LRQKGFLERVHSPRVFIPRDDALAHDRARDLGVFQAIGGSLAILEA
jgi:hypothetical protein